jgi:hypothetical protein
MSKKIFLLSFCFLLIGCSTTATKGIRGSDHTVVIPEVELGVTIVGDEVTDEQPEELGSRIALQASYTSLKGEFTQSLSAGQSVDYDINAPYTGNSRYDGPITLNHKADLSIGYLGGLIYWAASKEFALTYQLGLANIGMRLETAGGGLSSVFDDSETSLYAGVGLHYHYNSSIDLEGLHRAVMPKNFPLFFFTADDYYSIASDTTLRLVVKQNKWLKYFGGYRVVNYAYTCLTCDADPSTIHADFSGLYAGIGLNF